MYRKQRAASAVVVVLVLAAFATGETARKEYRFKVGRHRTSVSIVNPYGAVSVKPGRGKQVLVSAVLYSDKVEIDQTKKGNRIAVSSHLFDSADATSGRVDYEVQLPSDVSLTVHSATGSAHVERIDGDVVLEGNTANVDVRDVNSAHLHI